VRPRAAAASEGAVAAGTAPDSSPPPSSGARSQAPAAPPPPPPATLPRRPRPAQLAAFLQQWHAARPALSLGKSAAARIAAAVARGELPCSADGLCARVEALRALGGPPTARDSQHAAGAFDGARLLAAAPVAALRLETSELAAALDAAARLLPAADATDVLAALAPRLAPGGTQAAVLRYAEVDGLFRGALGAPAPAGAHALLAVAPPDAWPARAAALRRALGELAAAVGAAPAYALLAGEPRLLGLPAAAVSERLASLRRCLRLASAYEATQLAERCGALLLAPPRLLAARAEAAGGALGLPRPAALALLRRRPELLLQQSGVVQDRWTAALELCALWPAWAAEAAAADGGGGRLRAAAAAAGGGRRRRLEFLLRSGEAGATSAWRALSATEEDFRRRFPRFAAFGREVGGGGGGGDSGEQGGGDGGGVGRPAGRARLLEGALEALPPDDLL